MSCSKLLRRYGDSRLGRRLRRNQVANVAIKRPSQLRFLLMSIGFRVPVARETAVMCPPVIEHLPAIEGLGWRWCKTETSCHPQDGVLLPNSQSSPADETFRNHVSLFLIY